LGRKVCDDGLDDFVMVSGQERNEGIVLEAAYHVATMR
jgi:hypothetical protein